MVTPPPPPPVTKQTQQQAPQQQKPQTTQPKQQNVDIIPILTEEVRRLSERMKELEYELQLLKKKIEVFNQNMLTTFKKDKDQIDILKSDLEQFRKNLNQLTDLMNKMVSELKGSAKKEDVMRLEKYIDFWKPIEFVTYSGLDHVLNEKIKEAFESFDVNSKIDEIIMKKVKNAFIEVLAEYEKIKSENDSSKEQ
ncbi:MAG: hypothetical protein QXS41_03020 [Candidatus Woesearchaeota archaeon]